MPWLTRFLPQTMAATVAWVGIQSASAQSPVGERLPTSAAAPVEKIAPMPPAAPPVTAPVVTPMAVPAPAPVPDGGACPACGGSGCDSCQPFNFKKVPPVRTQTRAGMFPIPPSGKGAYNLLAAVQGKEVDAPPKFGYAPSALQPLPFYDGDWRYLDDPKTPPKDRLDELKRIHLGDDWLMAVGGQAWTRYMNEYSSRLTNTNNVYQLSRFRPYLDLWYKDVFRFYVEANVTYTQFQDVAPLVIDESGPDIQNLFIDVKLGDVANAPVYLRAGRQELSLGSQRLISALDWANTRRTFQGLRLLRTGEKLDFDAFVLQPVVPNANKLDSGDNNQLFAGTFMTYRPKKGQAIDLYYLILDNVNNVTQQGIVRAPATTHTVGGRYYGDKDLNDCYKLLWDVEGGLQFGQRGQQDIFAGFASAGAGINFRKAAWNPTLWATYDYASGDDSPNGGSRYSTFNQLFPFGHYYLGWADLVGRQNIHDVNFSLYLYPQKWLTTNIQVHNFWLDSVRDGLYNTAGVAYRRDATGRASPYVGSEVDIINNFHLTRRTDFLVSYAYLFGGGFLRDTAAPGAGTNASTLAALFNIRY
ncbi:alginate export family protein [Limnoglobus roseus]|uniref:Alginate export family protein n=1 Tax=Limnoglobus roseus TaxID=2598579 RepID=A0A5C1A855_9BACT|nr:alginate export family protein [Limnoglobus roseus]QEL15391.1 alginate export family protein [Limnoglobus roseus]